MCIRDRVKLILSAGFDANHKNHFGKTPLFYAIENNYHETVRVLLDYGANISQKYQNLGDGYEGCSMIEQWNRTPLMHAAQHSDKAMLKLLLDRGANLQDKDVLGSTAIDYANKSKKDKNAAFLKKLKEKGHMQFTWHLLFLGGVLS